MMRWSCIFLLSSCSARGRRLLSLLLGFASVPLPAAPAAFRGVSCRRLPFWGYATCLAPDACSAPAVELSIGFAVSLVRRLFSALCRALPLAPAVLRSSPYRWLPFGVSTFFWPRLPALLLRWWRRLGCRPSLLFSVLLLRQLACQCSLGSATCDRVLPLRL